jgi:hypothetical protein
VFICSLRSLRIALGIRRLRRRSPTKKHVGSLLLSTAARSDSRLDSDVEPARFLTPAARPHPWQCPRIGSVSRVPDHRTHPGRIARSLRAAVQVIVAGFGTNLGDAISWLLLVVPSLMIPMGILGAALATVAARAIGRAVRGASSDEVAADSAGTGRTSGS